MKPNVHSKDSQSWKWIFTGIGGILCIIAILLCINNISSLQGTTATQGEIISCSTIRTYNSNTHTYTYSCLPTVHFTTTSGKQIDFTASFSSNTFHVGGEVTVNYHPNNPHDAFISTFMNLWFIPLILGIIGLVLVVFSRIM